jgi:hypothetical protein
MFVAISFLINRFRDVVFAFFCGSRAVRNGEINNNKIVGINKKLN